MQTEIDYEKLGKRIKKTRIEKNLTQETLAEMIDCNISHISNIENNYTKLSLNALLAIANALNVSIDYLLMEQLASPSVVNNEVLRKLEKCNSDTKEKIIQIIDILTK